MADHQALRQRLIEAGAEFESFGAYSAPAHFGDPAAEQAALIEGVVLADASSRTQIALTGDDRAALLHNMCTNDVRKLSPGGGCEAFLTNAQGKILAYVTVFCHSDHLVLETVPGQSAAIMAQLDRYLIRENVELADLADSRSELLLAGPRAAQLLQQQAGEAPPAEILAHREIELSGTPVSARRVELAGADTFLLDCADADAEKLWCSLRTAGATPCGELAVEAVRIAAGIPAYGRDITEKNLPQEVGRDRQAISFTKGCYIGQETVARIDALGHVNRLLVRLVFSGKRVPAPGDVLTVDDREVGHVTSAAHYHPRQAVIALAYVRSGSNQPGTRLSSTSGEAIVQPAIDDPP